MDVYALTSRSSTIAVLPEDLGFGLLFWTMRDAVVVGDVTTGTIVLWNPAAERLFGWTTDEAVGCSLELIVPEHLRDAHRTGLARYAAQGSGPLVDSEVPVEVPARHKDGTELFIELSLTPLPPRATNQGQSRPVLALIRDATTRQRLVAEREAVLSAAQAAAARLEELAEFKASFTAMVAHELGSPTAAIRALVDLLIRGAVPPENQAGVLTTIQAEAHLIQRLIADVGGMAVIERDDFLVQRRPVPVSVLLADAVAFARTLSGDHPIREAIADAAMTTQVVADPDRIGQVLRNLLNNAAKHTPGGTPIELRARREEAWVRFEVADAGPGIPADELDRIFVKFGRGRNAEGQRRPGLGLGLYLARRIVQAHGSELTVTSREGEATIFGFTLVAVC